MAITIQQAPPLVNSVGFVPGFNDIVFVVSSTNTAQTNFQYVCDVYITDDSGAVSHAGNAYLRTKTPVDPLYSSGVFNISDKIRSFLSYDNGNDEKSFQKSPNSVIQFVCKFGEEYGASSGVVVYPDLTTSSTYYAVNASLTDLEANTISLPIDYALFGTSTTKKFLTNRPSSGIVRTENDGWVSHANSFTNANYNAVIKTYNSTGGIQDTYYIANPYATVTTSVGRRVQRFPAGVNNILKLNTSHILSGQAVVDFTAVQRYQIYLVNASSAQTSEPQWYVIDDQCTDQTVYTLHFLNKLGGFDTFPFIHAHVKTTDVKKENFKRNKVTRIGGGRYGYNNYDLNSVQYNTTSKDKVKIISDWISEEDSTWLEELITSPVVFVDDPTYGRVAINIVETSYTHKQRFTDKVFNLEITFEYSDDNRRQSL